MQEPAQPALDVEELEERRRPQPGRVRKEREDQRAEESVQKAARASGLDLGALLLDEDVVAHARGTGGDAGHAAQAPIEVRDYGIAQRRLAIREPLHQI